jgi:hypothetical protein
MANTTGFHLRVRIGNATKVLRAPTDEEEE